MGGRYGGEVYGRYWGYEQRRPSRSVDVASLLFYIACIMSLIPSFLFFSADGRKRRESYF
jgi:hypothetical protein